MRKIRINQGRVISGMFLFGILVMTFVLIVAAFAKLPEVPAVICAIILCFTFPMTWSSYYIFELDLDNKVIYEYIWIMGRRFQESRHDYEGIEKIFINRVNVAQNYQQYTGAVRTIRTKELAAYILLSDGTKFHLTNARSEAEMNKKLQKIAEKLSVEVTKNYE